DFAFSAITGAMMSSRLIIALIIMLLAQGVRYDKYTDNASETQPLGYASGAYAWQLTDNAKFTQGVSVFGAEDTTLNSESALNVAINEHFGLKVAYNVTWNSEPPESAPEHTDRRTTLSLGYSM
ncbi:DUF481 domain-containing protein, partial [Escherichia coli]|uniref:DUF481 domain-containing protein n=1 Tax=Escherichia coli TaxID=562 RepID=UPI003EE5F3F9